MKNSINYIIIYIKKLNIKLISILLLLEQKLFNLWRLSVIPYLLRVTIVPM